MSEYVERKEPAAPGTFNIGTEKSRNFYGGRKAGGQGSFGRGDIQSHSERQE